MPKRAKELAAIAVKNLTYKPNIGKDDKLLPCVHAVGGVGGLYLQITPSGEGKSWVLRTVIGTKRRGIGLGPYPEVGLARARELAAEMKEKIRNGIDPVQERKDALTALKAEQRRGLTFGKALDQYAAVKLGELSSGKHRDLWMNSMRTYVIPYLGDMLVSDIVAEDVRLCLMQHTDKGPFWEGKTDTARRVRGRIENILDWSTVKGHREGDNPARWKGNLKELLGNPRKIAKSENQPALQDKDAARWFAKLRERDGNGSRALEFLALKQRKTFKEEPPRVLFATHDFAHMNFPGDWTPNAVVIDEVLRTGGIDLNMASKDIPLDAMLGPDSAKRRLEEHEGSVPDDLLDLSEVKRHRLKGEVLGALAEGRRYYSYKGEIVVPHVRPYIYQDTPLLVLDGTFRRELAELSLGDFDRVVEIKARRNVETIHVCGTAATKYSMLTDKTFNSYMKTAVDRALENGWMVAGYKSVLHAWGLAEHPQCVWFGNSRGVDHLKNCPGGLVIGRNYPPVHILQNIAQVLGDYHGFEVTHVGDGSVAESFIGVHPVNVPSHADPIVRALLEISREDELMQVVDRLRLVWHDGPPKPLVIINEIPLPDLTPDFVVEWKNFKKGRLFDRLEHAVLTGLMPSSPNQAVRLRPDVWNSKSTAERDYKALTAQYPNWRDTLVESDYKPEGGSRRIKVLNCPEECEEKAKYQEMLRRLGIFFNHPIFH